MSMIGHFLRISPAQLEQVIQAPDRAAELVYPDDGAYPYMPDALDLDKSWHLIHFLLVGEAWGGNGPLASAVLGGESLEGTDAGYGPFRYLRPGEVKDVSAALDQISASELWSRFDVKKVVAADIYPSPWDGSAEDQEYVCQNFEGLKKFYEDAALQGAALLLYIA